MFRTVEDYKVYLQTLDDPRVLRDILQMVNRFKYPERHEAALERLRQIESRPREAQLKERSRGNPYSGPKRRGFSSLIDSISFAFSEFFRSSRVKGR